MNQSIIHRIISLTLALLMLLTSMGFSMDIHYCQGDIQSISLIGKAKSCEKMTSHTCAKSVHKCHQEKTDKPACHSTALNGDCTKDCCHNKTIKIHNLDEDSLLSSTMSLDFIQVQFLFAFVSTFYTEIHFDELPLIRFQDHSPPLIEKDFQVLFQSFLI